MTTTSVQTTTAPFDDLAASLRGVLVRPGDADYDAARAVYSAMHRYDPSNFFHVNQNIEPSPLPSPRDSREPGRPA